MYSNIEQIKRLTVRQTLSQEGFESIQELWEDANASPTGAVPACCTCGAWVEQDGQCMHGNPSVLDAALFGK